MVVFTMYLFVDYIIFVGINVAILKKTRYTS